MFPISVGIDEPVSFLRPSFIYINTNENRKNIESCQLFADSTIIDIIVSN